MYGRKRRESRVPLREAFAFVSVTDFLEEKGSKTVNTKRLPVRGPLAERFSAPYLVYLGTSCQPDNVPKRKHDTLDERESCFL